MAAAVPQRSRNHSGELALPRALALGCERRRARPAFVARDRGRSATHLEVYRLENDQVGARLPTVATDPEQGRAFGCALLASPYSLDALATVGVRAVRALDRLTCLSVTQAFGVTSRARRAFRARPKYREWDSRSPNGVRVNLFALGSRGPRSSVSTRTRATRVFARLWRVCRSRSTLAKWWGSSRRNPNCSKTAVLDADE